MKTRVNSRINNIKGKAKNSFLTKRQGFKSCARSDALGYCLFHQVYVGEKMFSIKNCNKCNRFIVLDSI